MHDREVEVGRRQERRGVEQYAPPLTLRRLDQVQPMSHAAEVALCGEGEQARRLRARTESFEWIVEPEVGVERKDAQGRPRARGKLSNAVDRVVVVLRQRERAIGPEGEAFPHQAACSTGIRGEHRGVQGGVGVEEAEDGSARLVHVARRGQRGPRL
jgi:hypothetical protein